ncbi:MAG: PIN domain-containing protein [Patulibacter sp.]
MSIVLDTSFVVALMSATDVRHEAAVELFRSTDQDFVTTPLALAEIDAAAGRLGSEVAQQAIREDFDSGVFALRWWADGLRDALAICRDRPDIGLTDASLVALAARLHTTRIATFDPDPFRSLSTRDGQPFVLLPADAQHQSLTESEGSLA